MQPRSAAALRLEFPRGAMVVPATKKTARAPQPCDGAAVPADGDAPRVLIGEVIQQALGARGALRDLLPDDGGLAYSEAEGAALLGLHSWQLRDERLRGRIPASRITGRKIRYTRQDLLEYLAA